MRLRCWRGDTQLLPDKSRVIGKQQYVNVRDIDIPVKMECHCSAADDPPWPLDRSHDLRDAAQAGGERLIFGKVQERKRRQTEKLEPQPQPACAFGLVT